MAVEIVKERWKGRVLEMVLGSGTHTVKVGGDAALPFLHFEGQIPNRPATALEVWDRVDGEFPPMLAAAFEGVLGSPGDWARRCVEYGADMVALRLVSTHPEGQDAGAEEAAAAARMVAEAVEVPLIVLGCGVEEKDAAVLPAVAAALDGRNCLVGFATSENYKTVVAACIAHGHSVIATSPLDINLAKQLNILITDMNLPPERIAMDPSIGSLGYGIEYAWSIIERMRLGALSGDRMLSQPVICFVGDEAWKVKETTADDVAEWGEQGRRALLWEAMTAVVLAQAGGSIFVFRHPEAMQHFNRQIDALMRQDVY